MTIQLIISGLLAGILIFTLIQQHIGQFLRFTMFTSISTGLVVTWMPELANSIANHLGVGRGADLLFYLWILVSMLALFTVYLALKKKDEQITDLTRALAIHIAECSITSGSKK